jgi:hypothetical protein
MRQGGINARNMMYEEKATVRRERTYAVTYTGIVTLLTNIPSGPSPDRRVTRAPPPSPRVRFASKSGRPPLEIRPRKLAPVCVLNIKGTKIECRKTSTKIKGADWRVFRSDRAGVKVSIFI